MDKLLTELINNNLKILINKSTSEEKSILASKDFIQKIKDQNLRKTCLIITDLIFNEKIVEVEFESTFSVIDIDCLAYGLYEIYKYIISRVKLSKKQNDKIMSIILSYIEDLEYNSIYNDIIKLFIY